MAQEIKTTIPGAAVLYGPHPDEPEKHVCLASRLSDPEFPMAVKALKKWCGNPKIRHTNAKAGAKAFFFVANADGSITPQIKRVALYFYKRDGDQALTFEWNRFDQIFEWRPLSYFQNLKRIKCL